MVYLVLTDLRSGLQGGGPEMRIGPHHNIWIDNDTIRTGTQVHANRVLIGKNQRMMWKTKNGQIWPDAIIESER